MKEGRENGQAVNDREREREGKNSREGEGRSHKGYLHARWPSQEDTQNYPLQNISELCHVLRE